MDFKTDLMGRDSTTIQLTRHTIEKQHPIVGEGNFIRLRHGTALD